MKLSFNAFDPWIGISSRPGLVAVGGKLPEIATPITTPVHAFRLALPNRVIHRCTFYRVQFLPCVGFTFRILGPLLARPEETTELGDN